MTSTTISNWREYFLTSKQFHYLDENLIQLWESIDPNTEILKNFDDISKKTGVCFIALDPSETKLQLFCHPLVIGGSWKNPNKSMIAFIDLEFSANQ